MPNFFDKLKKGMKTDVKDYYEEEKEIEEERTKDENPISPKEINKEELEEELDSKEGEIKSAANSFVLGSIVKEVEKKPKTLKSKKIVSKPAVSRPAVKQDFMNWVESEPSGQLVIDLFETPTEIIIQSAIAGISPENLDISIENDMVSIKGRRAKVEEEEGANYLISECYWGNFLREIILPSEVDAGNSDASMKNGVLTIRMPKLERAKKKLSVK